MSDLALHGGSPVRTKPFPHWPVFDESEERALVEVLRSGQWWRYSMGEAVDPGSVQAGAHSKVGEFQKMFAEVQGARYGIACATGTGAIEVVLKAMGIGPGDEVIVPPYTFVATATAPMLIGATPVFVDIDLDTLNLDPARLEEAITPQTKAVMPVHFAGLAADMEAILAICGKHGIRGGGRRLPRAWRGVEGPGPGHHRAGRDVQFPGIEEHDGRRRRADHHR